MASASIRPRATGGATPTPAFDRFAGLCGMGAALVGFLYAIAFVILRSDVLSALFLLLGGALSSAVLVALYGRLRPVDPGFALWAMLLTVAGALGSAIHGGYDLASTLHPPPNLPADIANPVDPRGLLTFGLAGLGVLFLAWLMRRGGEFAPWLGLLGYVLAVLLLLLYLARLIVLDATSPLILVPALLTGFLVNPAWYLWVGVTLWTGKQPDRITAAQQRN